MRSSRRLTLRVPPDESTLYPEVLELLRIAGWSPERRLDQSVDAFCEPFLKASGLPLIEPAKFVLERFGGLVVPSDGPGISISRCGFDFDVPRLALDYLGPVWASCSKNYGATLFPLARMTSDHGRLVCDPNGVFGTIDEISRIWIWGSFERAMNCNLLGICEPLVVHPLQW